MPMNAPRISPENPLLPESLHARLRSQPAHWLVTGVAGFIGSNLLEALLRAGQRVTGIDNFSTGFQRNLDEVRALVGDEAWARFRFVEGDIRDDAACADVCAGVDYVLHQAALGSVPRSIERPVDSFDSNVSGFVRVMTAARDAGVKRFVYASSSSVYGDSPELPKVEERIGKPLSPYAATKYVDEVFAEVYARTYGMQCVGLRYFNVFGPRQDPDGAYAAVIPRWIAALLRGEPVVINGDGETSRDFCYVANAVQANVLAGLVDAPVARGAARGDGHLALNVACAQRTSLLELLELLRVQVQAQRGVPVRAHVDHRDFRAGDVRHSLASIERITAILGYRPTHLIGDGIQATVAWHLQDQIA